MAETWLADLIQDLLLCLHPRAFYRTNQNQAQALETKGSIEGHQNLDTRTSVGGKQNGAHSWWSQLKLETQNIQVN